MYDILVLLLTSFGLGVLCSIPTILFGRWLATRDIVSEPSIGIEIMIATCAVFFWQLLLPQISLWLFVIIYMVVSPYRAHRDKLWAYFLKGKQSKENE